VACHRLLLWPRLGKVLWIVLGNVLGHGSVLKLVSQPYAGNASVTGSYAANMARKLLPDQQCDRTHWPPRVEPRLPGGHDRDAEKTTQIQTGAVRFTRRAGATKMKQRTSHTLFTYWNEVRAGRIAPRRFEIEPSRIGGILSETFILERTASPQPGERDIYRYRLAGTKLCDQFGTDFRGREFLDAWDLDDRATLEQTLSGMAERGGVCVLTFDALTAAPKGAPGRSSTAGRPTSSKTGRKKVSFEALLLPLVHTSNTLDRYLGCMTPLDQPSWLGTERLTETSLLRCELIWPDGRPHPVVEKARHQTPFLPEIRNARLVRSERRQFRVYEGGLSKSSASKSPHDV
jgi:hypothetical protein